MKTCICLLGAFGLWLASPASLRSQTPIPFDSFESLAVGNLNGQGGWTVTNLGGTSQALVSIDYALSGLKSMYLADNDTVNNPKAWREPTGINVTSGRFDFAALESPDTPGRDYWSVLFSHTGSSVANFKLALTDTATLALYGGTGAATLLAAVSPASTSYNPAAWNTFTVIFDASSDTVSVYLNGATSPVLTATDASTTWAAGRYTLCPGNSTFTGMAVYFDESLPEWEYTDKLRYAPPTLVAPTTWTPSAGFNTRTFAADEDVIVQLSPTVTRTGNLGVVSGRHVRIIGGDLGTTYIAPTAQTASLFLEGLKADHSAGLPVVNGVPVDLFATRSTSSKEKDAIDVCGTTSGSGADVFVQNCSITGVHGTRTAHGAAVPIASITCTAISGLGFTVTLNTSAPLTLPAGTNWVIVGATTRPALAGTYRIILASPTTASSFTATRWDNWNPLPSGLTVDATGTGGYAWPNDPTISPLHADGFESMAEGMHNIAYFYRVTLDSNASCLLSRNQLDTQGGRGLVMTRVNMSVNNVWPQDYDSQSLHIGTTDQSGGGWGSNGFPVLFDRVYLKTRPDRELTAAVHPGAGNTRSGVDVGAYSTDGDATVRWPAALGVTGIVTRSTSPDGYPLEPSYTTRDYASLTGSDAPGLNYVSPGYSSDALQPLVLDSVTGSPALSALTVAASSPVGTLVTRLDVSFTGAGHVIDLSLEDPSGHFGMDAGNRRNVIVQTPLASGTWTVTAAASEQGNPTNRRTQVFTIVVP